MNQYLLGQLKGKATIKKLITAETTNSLFTQTWHELDGWMDGWMGLSGNQAELIFE